MNVISLLILTLFLLVSGQAFSDVNESRKKLRDLIEFYDVTPLESEPFEITKKYILGQALFFDPILSSNNDISCATCHLVSKGTSDGRERSLGTGSFGLSTGRKSDHGHVVNHRNSQMLYNRNHNTVKNLFWDGRVEVLDPKKRVFRSPLRHLLPKSIENALAAQALFPLVDNREMFSKNCLGDTSCGINLEDPVAISEEHYRILDRLLGLASSKSKLTKVQVKYRKLFRAAYPKLIIDQLDIGHLGNAIAHFEEVAFATRDAAWDKYVSGEEGAISDGAVEGANIFYGRGKCASCHSGDVFSDYKFYSLGVLSYKEISPIKVIDFGRYSVTKDKKDKFLFRTPALRNITLSYPYFHDGSEWQLKDAIQKHNHSCKGPDELMSLCSGIHFSPNLDFIQSLNEQDIKYLIEFMKSLEDNIATYWDHVVPRSLPSELPVDSLLFVQ